MPHLFGTSFLWQLKTRDDVSRKVTSAKPTWPRRDATNLRRTPSDGILRNRVFVFWSVPVALPSFFYSNTVLVQLRRLRFYLA